MYELKEEKTIFAPLQPIPVLTESLTVVKTEATEFHPYSTKMSMHAVTEHDS
jgi:hypothetical protein